MHRLTLATLTGAALLPTLLLGVQPEPQDSSSVSSARRFHDSVVVTATVADSEADEIPATVRVLDRQEIRDRQVTAVTDLIDILPGVNAVTLGSPGQQASVFVRGAESDQTLVLWNGIPLNDPYFGGYNWAFLPTEGVERVEVVGGPFSALYGSAAAGGVIQLITGNEPGVWLSIEGGENAHRRLSTSLTHRQPRTTVDLHGHWREGDGNYPNDFYDSLELAGNLGLAVNDAVQLGVRGRVNDSSTGVPFDGVRASLERQIDWRESQLALPLEVSLEHWDVAGYVERTDYDNHFSDPEDPFGFTEGRTESIAQRGRLGTVFRPGTGLWIGGGVEVEDLEVTDRSSFGSNLDRVEQQTVALFGQVHFALGSLSADVGARYDDNDVFGSETSPRVGLVFAASDSIRLRGSYGQGFRAPSLGELFFPFSGNPGLEPERSEGYEVGAAWERSVWTLDLATFETKFSNLIDYDFASGRNLNVGRARTRGTEIELRFRATRWEVRGQWTHLDAQNLDSGEALKRRPDDSGSLVMTFRPGKWSFNSTSRYVGDRPDVDPVTFETANNGSYFRHDLAARWQLSPRWAPYLRVLNVSDEQYAEALGFPAPGRTLTGGVQLSF